jgi:hypothetical protein
MHIANPIYDVVFKYMMEDNRVAKAFLSAIIQEKVVELDFASQERTIRIPAEKDNKTKIETKRPEINYTVCRFDFSARIATSGGGFKTVVIELQKAKLMSDIMRFRRYLGLHYQNPENTYGYRDDPKARQIYCIFILGHDIGIPGCAVIRIDSTVWDVTTGRELNVPGNEFIDGIHHRSWIVQAGELKHSRRTDLEKMLAVFDPGKRHILDVDENDYPKNYRSIIRRLRMATESEQIQIEMEMEDDYLEELRYKERKIALKDKIIEEKDKALEEKDKVLEEKDKEIEELKRLLREKQ